MELDAVAMRHHPAGLLLDEVLVSGSFPFLCEGGSVKELPGPGILDAGEHARRCQHATVFTIVVVSVTRWSDSYGCADFVSDTRSVSPSRV